MTFLRRSFIATLVLAFVGCAPSSGDEGEAIAALMEACFPPGLVDWFPPETAASIRAGADEGLVGLSRIGPADIDCLAAAGSSCAAASACLGITAAPRATPCTLEMRCEGAVLVHCYTPAIAPDRIEVRYDCAARGLGCFESEGGPGAACGEGPCEIGAPPSCDGDVLRYCDSGAIARRTCSSGTSCDPELGCVGPPCTESECVGDVARSCHRGRIVSADDCSLVGMECVPGACRPPHEEFTLATRTCDGDSVVYCLWDGGK